MSKHGKILVGMSGGIDSTIAALMLKDQGYEVIGITMKTWDYASSVTSKKETGCCNLDSFNDARKAAVEHGFPHYVLDIREEFGGAVIENFVDEYMAGRTPNPCVMCNTHIKWSAMLKRANALDCEFIATGHYAKVKNLDNRFYISKGDDDNKDQSYVLWGLTQECLSRSYFPLGQYHKPQIREMALAYGYPELASKSESYEICFVPDNNYRDFLRKKIPTIDEQIGEGDFLSVDGKFLGKHKGFPYYTIGQRKGLDLAFGVPMYVTEIIADKNQVVLGEAKDLERSKMLVGGLNLQKYDTINPNIEALTKIRYKDKGAFSKLIMTEDKIEVDFDHEVRGIAPGQSAVFYEGDDVVGGGIIHKSYY